MFSFLNNRIAIFSAYGKRRLVFRWLLIFEMFYFFYDLGRHSNYHTVFWYVSSYHGARSDNRAIPDLNAW